MWILSRVNNDDKVYLLCDKPKYTVGRNKTCDIVAESTQSSLGRFHATLHPYEDRVEVLDTESKYGTYVNEQINSNVKISPNERIPLRDGDTIRFGFIDFTWKLEKSNIVALSSTLTDREKDNLKKDVSTLGGQVIDQWSDTCTHLVVKNLTLTVKVLQGLCHAIPIIKPEYFKTLLQSIRNKSDMPKVETYQPAIVERIAGSTVSLQPNIDRKRLFVNKTFIFMSSRHMERFRGIIECGMGQCSSLDTKKWQRKSLVKTGFIVVSDTTSSTQSQVATQTANELNDFIRSKGSRMIPESEISLAVLNCSLEKFCNPKHTLKDNFENKSQAIASNLLVDNTPEANPSETAASTVISSINLPETIENTLAATVPSINSHVISLLDDDDDVMLVLSADLAVSMGGANKGKRKNSTDYAEPLLKKPNLNKSSESTTKSIRRSADIIPQRSTRSVSKNNLFSSTKDATEKQVPSLRQETEPFKKPDTEPSSSRSRSRNDLPMQNSIQHESPVKLSMEISAVQHPESQNRTQSSTRSQTMRVTSTQIETPKRKRIAHRSNTSAFGAGNNSDSDDGLFNFTDQPSLKKSKPSRESDSDSDDNRNYPQSSGPVAPIPISLRPLTQQSQVDPDTWLSRPTPTQTFTNTTIRSRPSKRHIPEQPKAANSTAWRIGQYCISTPPIPIPTQGWYSKDTIKSVSFENEVKQETSTGKSLLEDTKWLDSFKCGIQVITKSMNLMSTTGKVFKKQGFIVPTEIIKTSKVYEF